MAKLVEAGPAKAQEGGGGAGKDGRALYIEQLKREAAVYPAVPCVEIRYDFSYTITLPMKQVRACLCKTSADGHLLSWQQMPRTAAFLAHVIVPHASLVTRTQASHQIDTVPRAFVRCFAAPVVAAGKLVSRGSTVGTRKLEILKARMPTAVESPKNVCAQSAMWECSVLLCFAHSLSFVCCTRRTCAESFTPLQ